MNTRFKVFASNNILQYLCEFIHVLIFVTVSKCRKNPKLTNIVIYVEMVSQTGGTKSGLVTNLRFKVLKVLVQTKVHIGGKYIFLTI
jgi:hypothetical protein